MMTIKNKILAVLLTISVNVFAAAWTGANSEPSSTRTIDGKKFYVISTPDELAWSAKEVNNANAEINAVLNNDIVFGKDTASTCSNSWTPIGRDSTTMFNGTFNGNGYTIYGMKLGVSTFVGLFGVSGSSAEIKSLIIGKSSVLVDSLRNTFNYAGLLIGVNNGIVYNIKNLGSVEYNGYGEIYYRYSYVGSICGMNNGTISDVMNDGIVNVHERAKNTKYEKCQTASMYLRLGGIVGINNGILNRVVNLKNVSGVASATSSYPAGSVCPNSSTAYVGGVFGDNVGSVENTINMGDVSGLAATHYYSGGIGGLSKGVLKNSYSVVDNVEGKINGGVAGVLSNGVNVYFNSDLFSIGAYGEGSSNIDVTGKTTLEMQKDQFAWILNTTNGTEENSGVWSRYDGYPVYANDSLLPIHKIVFNDGENTTIFYTNYQGKIEDFPEIPAAPSGKAFAGWVDEDGKSVDSTTKFMKDQTISADMKDWEDVVYTIRFLDEKGNVLDLQSVHSGEIPVYGGSKPTKKASVAYTYSFAGWSPEITAATWHTDYQVLFDSTLNQYKITYLDYDGTELYSAMFDYGKKPSYSTIPKREKTVAYIYAFAGWSPTVESVSGEATYKAVYDSSLQKYAIQFMNGEESLLSKDVEYGTVPKYDGDVPTKTATKEYSYSFVGWTPEISKVTEATSYVAKFDSSLNKYMVVFQNGAKVLQSSEIEYGKVPAYKGESPQKTSTAKYDYAFSSWSPALSKVTDEVTYTALFDSTIRSYEIAFVSEGETLQAIEHKYGSLPKYEGKEPTKKESKGYTYSFKGWNPSIAMVKEKATYIAVFDSVAKKFIVTFMNGKDTLQSSSVAYGKNPEYKGKTPTKSSSSKYEYKFAGWSPKLTSVTEKVVYKAVFDSTVKSGLMTSRNFAKNFAVSVWGTQIQIANAKIGSSYALFDLQGLVVVKGVVKQKSFVIKAKNRGRYIVRIGLESKPVVVK